MAIFGVLESSGPYNPRAVGRTPRSTVCGGYWRPPGPKFDGDPGVQGDHKLAQSPRQPPLWPGPIDGAKATKILASPRMQRRSTVINSAPKGP
ncbi:hypothetical protein O181_126811 [Austropuccinia psidii MF-1]|uniref:Uncharacterized protein n=1 Tax=Austropuccinia psidii MF-1 TaxID=1389203 RepID=A0A9Q3KVS6_9BASI|nr:hypothetical protein [Austropuccinia psidii MF-1]